MSTFRYGARHPVINKGVGRFSHGSCCWLGAVHWIVFAARESTRHTDGKISLRASTSWTPVTAPKNLLRPSRLRPMVSQILNAKTILYFGGSSASLVSELGLHGYRSPLDACMLPLRFTDLVVVRRSDFS